MNVHTYIIFFLFYFYDQFQQTNAIVSRIPSDSLPTVTWPTQTINFPITDNTHLQFSCSESKQPTQINENATVQVKSVKYLPITHTGSPY